MKNNLPEYDTLIQKFIHCWENSSTYQDYKKAVSYAIVYKLYGEIRRITSFSKYSFQKREGNIFTLNKLKNLLWYFVWTLKWITFNFRKSNSILFTCLYPSRNTTFIYMNSILAGLESNKTLIINFGTLHKINYLFDKRVQCLPVALYKIFCFLPRTYKQISITIQNELDRKIEEWFGNEICKIQICKELNNLFKLKKIFVYILSIFKGKSILFLTDTDYDGHGLIFVNICKSYKVKTISVEHSFIIYNHLAKNKYADIALVWGKYQDERINKVSEFLPAIKIIGFPVNKIDYIKKEHKYWLYILSSYNLAGIQTFQRNVSHSWKFISHIYSESGNKNNFPKLLIRRHPNDHPGILSCKSISYFHGDLKKIIPYIEIIFFEDTSLILTLLQLDIPLIYCTDAKGNDHYGLNKYPGAVIFANDYNGISSKIYEAKNSIINYKSRLNLLNYFAYQNPNFNKCFYSVIKENLEFEKN